MNFYENLKDGNSTIGSTQGEDLGLTSQFGDLTIGDPEAHNKFNNPGAQAQDRPIKSTGNYNVEEADDDGAAMMMFEDNLAEISQVSEDDTVYMDKVMNGFQ